MKREFPSTPAEAFEASIEEAYFAEQMAQAELQGRVVIQGTARAPCSHGLGPGGWRRTAIWFWQKPRGKIYLVGYLRLRAKVCPTTSVCRRISLASRLDLRFAHPAHEPALPSGGQAAAAFRN